MDLIVELLIIETMNYIDLRMGMHWQFENEVFWQGIVHLWMDFPFDNALAIWEMDFSFENEVLRFENGFSIWQGIGHLRMDFPFDNALSIWEWYFTFDNVLSIWEWIFHLRMKFCRLRMQCPFDNGLSNWEWIFHLRMKFCGLRMECPFDKDFKSSDNEIFWFHNFVPFGLPYCCVVGLATA